MVLNRVGDSMLATHLVMNAGRLMERADFNVDVVNVSRARVAAAGATGLLSARIGRKLG